MGEGQSSCPEQPSAVDIDVQVLHAQTCNYTMGTGMPQRAKCFTNHCLVWASQFKEPAPVGGRSCCAWLDGELGLTLLSLGEDPRRIVVDVGIVALSSAGS